MILDCVFNVWSPKIGDPHLMGWVTVACYFFVAILAYFVQRQTKYVLVDAGRGRRRAFWILILLALVFLGVNKQLDLQSFFTAAAKCVSKADGWYGDRKKYQELFIVGLAGFFLLLTVISFLYFWRDIFRNFLAILGFMFLLLFIMVRASSFHNFDALINYEIYGIRMNWLLELWGLGLIGLQAILNLSFGPKKPGRYDLRFDDMYDDRN